MGLGPDHVGGLAGRDHGRPRARFPCAVMRLTSLEPRANRGLALRDGTGVSGLDGADYLSSAASPVRPRRSRAEPRSRRKPISRAHEVRVGGRRVDPGDIPLPGPSRLWSALCAPITTIAMAVDG